MDSGLWDYVGKLFNENVKEQDWTGDNSINAGSKAAQDIFDDIYKWHLDNELNNRKEPIRLVGHSHGGNVAIMVTNLLAEKDIKVATPVREYKLETEVGQRVHVYNKFDAVQVLGGKAGRAAMAPASAFKGAKNVEVKLRWYYRDVTIFGIRNHSAMHRDIKTWKKYIEPILKI
ncbi:hypothetical protein EBB07_24750 [Paenibacillaceae bacterium]|nr:hypothetical protein EBB07_24750 [Paenibacillaceae bacterium]